MGFPNLPENIGPINVDLDAEDIAFLLLLSIAFEELSLAHIMNAEGEKLQAALGTLVDGDGNPVFDAPLASDLEGLLETNRSVERMLRTVAKKEMLLQWKFEDVLDFLGMVTTTPAPPPTTEPGECVCETAFMVDQTGVGSTISTQTPPRLIIGDADDTLNMNVDISCCEPEENTFTYSFVHPVPQPLTQSFIANTFNIECIFEEEELVGMVVTGQGSAGGTGAGHVQSGPPANYTLTLIEPNVVTLEISRGPQRYFASHLLDDPFNIEECTPTED